MKYTLLILALCLLLSGCGEAPVETPHFSVLGTETKITLDAPAEPVLEAMGAPFGYGERRSDRRKGVERTYRFSGLNLVTYPGQDGERILGLTVTGLGFRTPEGLAVGDTAARVRECYGPDAIREDCCILERSREKMVVQLQGGVVTSIGYWLI